MTTTEQRIADPFRGTQESIINRGLERDGIHQRVCLHPDQTVRLSEEGADVTECDYCPAVALTAPGLRAELPAWYWREP